MTTRERDRGMSGSNTTPLGSRGGGPPLGIPSAALPGPSLLKPSYLAMGGTMPNMPPPAAVFKNDAMASVMERKRTAEERIGRSTTKEEDKNERKRKRKSRWVGTEDDKTFIPGMPTMVPMGLSKEQEEAYICHLAQNQSTQAMEKGSIPGNTGRERSWKRPDTMLYRG